MSKVVSLIFFDYKQDPAPKQEHFTTTQVPAELVSAVIAYYAALRPELSGPVYQEGIENLFLDAYGPIYGGGNVQVQAPGGYTVTCPVSHADVVADYLMDCAKETPVQPGNFVIYHCMFLLAALPATDIPALAKGFAAHAQAAAIHRTVARTTAFSDVHTAKVNA